jgi:PDZ domain-containing protein
VFARLLTPLRLAFAGLVLIVVAFVILVTQMSDQYLETPDVAHPLASLVKVPGGKQQHDGGGIYYVDVFLKRASLLESLIPAARPDGSDLIPRSSVVEPGISEQQRLKLEVADMKASQVIASAVALRELGYRVPVKPGGLRVAAVTPESHAAAVLKTGDVVVSADGKPVRTRSDLRAILAGHRPGDTVNVGIRRGTRTFTISIRTTSDPAEPKRPLIGFLPTQAISVRFPFSIRFDLGGVGGPSAGLAFALELLEKRGRDVDHGYKVAATGVIELDGKVTRIGGIKQKTIGARRAHVDVFLVPVDGDNARDAKRYAHGLRIIPVENFQQALHALATLPSKA